MGNGWWHSNYRKVYAIDIYLNQIEIIRVGFKQSIYKEKEINVNFLFKQDIRDNPNNAGLYGFLNHLLYLNNFIFNFQMFLLRNMIITISVNHSIYIFC